MKRLYFLFLPVLFLYSFIPQSVSNSFKDYRDGKVYKTVTIGDQIWMAENLAYLPEVVDVRTGSEITPHYYVYDYNGYNVSSAKATSNYKRYGVLYNWAAAQTACPKGWHLPVDAEWKLLEEYLIANGYNYDNTTEGNKIAKSMATTTFWEQEEPSVIFGLTAEGTPGSADFSEIRNKSGFSALPGGSRYHNGRFSEVGIFGSWWTSTEDGTRYAKNWILHNGLSNLVSGSGSKGVGRSVRCVKGDNTLTVITGQVVDISKTTAICFGNVIMDGGLTVMRRGVCWSTTENPTITDFRTSDGIGTGSFSGNLSDLTPDTIYYVRAYATNAEGTVYGEQKSFITDYEIDRY